MVGMRLAMMASPAKRKRPVDLSADDANFAIGLAAAAQRPLKNKKARVNQADDTDDDDATKYALSTTASVADSNVITSTVTIAASNTPLTDASSIRSKTKPRPKKYLCTFPDCDKAFDRPVRLQTHLNSHTGLRPHVCPEEDCDKSFFKSEHLNRHLKEKHSDQSFVCEFQVRDDCTGQIAPCGKVFESANKLKRHVAMHEDKEETTCDWEGCGKVFRKQETLQRHIKKDHLHEDSYLCQRVLVDGGVCGQAFPTPGQLKGHEAREHNAPKYVCEVCTANATIGHHTVDDTMIQNDLDPEFLPGPADLEHMDTDMESDALHHPSLEDDAPAQLVYSGGIIGFATYHDLQRHTKLAHPPICTECGKKCRSSKDLTAHIDIMHPAPDAAPPNGLPITEKKFLCPYVGCERAISGNGFTKKGNMDVHVKNMHTKEKSFICGEYDLSGNKKVEGWNGKGCGMALQTKQSLIGHVRTQHIGVPAALNARTGLREKDRKRAVTSKKKSTSEDEAAMDIDTDVQSSETNVALSMLTGSGYDELRPLPCLVHGCHMRFTNDYELGTHMELTHGWTVDDINDSLEGQHGAHMSISDELLRQQLELQLRGDSGPLDPELQMICA